VNSVEVLNTGPNSVEIAGGGLFRVEMTWYFLSPNFPICELRGGGARVTTINIKQDDTQPAIRVRLKDSDGTR